MSPHSTPIHHNSLFFDLHGQKENCRNIYPTSVFHNHENESHSFLQEIFTDTGSLYNPTSEWDSNFTNYAGMTDQLEDINYNEFLENIFEPELDDSEEKETVFFINEELDQADSRPLISFSGAYNYDSSEDEHESKSHSPPKITSNTVDYEIESFFETNQGATNIFYS